MNVVSAASDILTDFHFVGVKLWRRGLGGTCPTHQALKPGAAELVRFMIKTTELGASSIRYHRGQTISAV
jgi:hypothetical protein